MNSDKNFNSRITLEDRERLALSGVTEVIAFDDESITADTQMGSVTIRGEGRHISRLNLEEGILQTEGNVDSIEYGDASAKGGGGMLGRLFR